MLRSTDAEPQCPLCVRKAYPGPLIPIESDTAPDRLCAAIAEVLERKDLTPEARVLVQLALRAQRGEVVDLRAEPERREEAKTDTNSAAKVPGVSGG